MDLKITVTAPGEAPSEYAISEQPVVLGREQGCDIVIPSQYVSRRHFLIEPNGSGFDVVDLGGRNPVQVNGQTVLGRLRLNPGDTITVADVTINVAPDAVSSGTVVFTPRREATSAQGGRRPATAPGEGIQGLWRSQNLAPGATVTIMFTDLERSTSMVTNLGEREAYKVMHLHNTLLREQFTAYRGHEAKRVGDGFLVLFASARDALHCAMSIQRRLALTESEPNGAIRVRIGVHIGEVLWDDNDIFGASVNFSARVMSEAQAGEILISALLREVISPSGEFSFGEERIVPLKGFKGLHKLTSLDWAIDKQ